MTLPLPMEHYTSNSGQMLKHHFSLLPERERMQAAWYVTDIWARRQSYFLLKFLKHEGTSTWRHAFTLGLFSVLPQEPIPNTWISKSQTFIAIDLAAQQAALVENI